MRRFAFILASLLQVLVQPFTVCVPIRQRDIVANASRRLRLPMDPRELDDEAVSTIDTPRIFNYHSQRNALGVNINKSFLSVALALVTTVLASKPVRADGNRDESIYTDPENGFSVMKLPGWSVMPKQPPTISLQKMQPEEVIFVASSFLEGEISLSSRYSLCCISYLLFLERWVLHNV